MTLFRQWQENHNISLTSCSSSIIRTWSTFILLRRVGFNQFYTQGLCCAAHSALSGEVYTFLKLKRVENCWRCSQGLAGLAGSWKITNRLKTATGEPAAHIPMDTHWHRAGNSSDTAHICKSLGHCLTSKFSGRVGVGDSELMEAKRARVDQGEVMCQQEESSLVPTMVSAPHFFQIKVSLLFSSLSPSDALLPSSSSFFSPFEAQSSFPLLPSLFVSCLSYYSANTCKHWDFEQIQTGTSV